MPVSSPGSRVDIKRENNTKNQEVSFKVNVSNLIYDSCKKKKKIQVTYFLVIFCPYLWIMALEYTLSINNKKKLGYEIENLFFGTMKYV